MARETPSQPKPRMPADREVRRALVESGLSPIEAAVALSHLLRPFRLDFFRRRRNRLLRLVQERLVVVAAKRKLLEILAAEEENQQRALNLEDLFTGVYRHKLGNLGERVMMRAVLELGAAGVIDRGGGSRGPDLVRLTGHPYDLHIPKLRDVHERMRRALGIKHARPYLPEKTWDV